MMKTTIIALLLTLFMMTAQAETLIQGDLPAEPAILPISSEEFGDFVVGQAGKLSGAFFTSLWGNSTYDMDVRALLHGYETVALNDRHEFIRNPTAIQSVDLWENTDGGKTYTLELAPGLLYNDGTPITAADYVFGLLLAGSPEVRELGGATILVSHIQGYDAFNNGTEATFSGLRLLDGERFSITVKPESLPFFYELSMVRATPYPISVIAPGCEIADEGAGAFIRNIDPSEQDPLFTSALLQQTLFDFETGYAAHPQVTSGPYQMSSFDMASGEARFTINPYFAGDWRGQKPVIDNIIITYVPPANMVTALEQGDVHLINKVVPSDDIQAGLNSDQPIQGYPYLRQGLGFLAYSCEEGPTQFAAVRKAIAYALGQNELVLEFNPIYGVPVYGYYGIGQWMVQLILAGGPAMAYDQDTADGEEQSWASLSLDNLMEYPRDLAEAKALLIEDGWTLNEAGEPFQEGADLLRYKNVNDGLMPLTLRFAKQQDNDAADIVALQLLEPARQLGIRMEIIEMSFGDLLNGYYRVSERPFEMAYLATNFSGIFDPYYVFGTDDSLQGVLNTSGLKDENLAQLALALRQTAPGDLLDYCERWLEFQAAFNDALPMLPLYSNIYFDFSVDELIGYDPANASNWPDALLYASLGRLADTLPGTDSGDTAADAAN